MSRVTMVIAADGIRWSHISIWPPCPTPPAIGAVFADVLRASREIPTQAAMAVDRRCATLMRILKSGYPAFTPLPIRAINRRTRSSCWMVLAPFSTIHRHNHAANLGDSSASALVTGGSRTPSETNYAPD